MGCQSNILMLQTEWPILSSKCSGKKDKCIKRSTWISTTFIDIKGFFFSNYTCWLTTSFPQRTAPTFLPIRTRARDNKIFPGPISAQTSSPRAYIIIVPIRAIEITAHVRAWTLLGAAVLRAIRKVAYRCWRNDGC